MRNKTFKNIVAIIRIVGKLSNKFKKKNGNGDDMVKLEVDENMPDGEVLLRFPKGQEHKNIRIINIGTDLGKKDKNHKN